MQHISIGLWFIYNAWPGRVNGEIKNTLEYRNWVGHFDNISQVKHMRGSWLMISPDLIFLYIHLLILTLSILHDIHPELHSSRAIE